MAEQPRKPQPSRSKTGIPLTAAQHQQRINAAQAAARRRQRGQDAAYRRAAGRQGPTRQAPTGPTRFTAGTGRTGDPSYVDTATTRNSFMAHGVSGADINQTKDPKSGFLTFSGKDPVAHQKFVDSLKAVGFRIAQRPDGSGYAVNAAGQGVRLGKPSTRLPQQSRKILKVNEETGQITSENPVRRVSSRSLLFR